MFYCRTDEASATGDKNDRFWLLNGHERRDGMMGARNSARDSVFNIPQTRQIFQGRCRIPTPSAFKLCEKHSTTAAACSNVYDDLEADKVLLRKSDERTRNWATQTISQKKRRLEQILTSIIYPV